MGGSVFLGKSSSYEVSVELRVSIRVPVFLGGGPGPYHTCWYVSAGLFQECLLLWDVCGSLQWFWKGPGSMELQDPAGAALVSQPLHAEIFP